MINTCNEEIIPIYKKINSIQIMNISKSFEKIYKTPCSCQLITKSSNHTWIFKYKINHRLFIILYFTNKNKYNHPHIIIDTFKCQGIHNKTILKTILNKVKNLDFEMILYKINEYNDMNFCENFGFKQINNNFMGLSLKPKFISNKII